ncbi:MAG: TonB-dependent receptor, partial [Prevotella sp.]|nr:TonB-dependent receptor [Prevotella sp.]
MAQKTDAMLFGDVKSKVDGKHIPYAKIQVKGTKLTTNCDKTGHFQLANLPVGQQVIVASSVGYQPQELTVTMRASTGTEVYFALEEEEQELNQVVVTGTRTQHFVKNVPIRTEVLTSRSIINKNAQNLFEALEGVPGVRVEQQCQFCNFSTARMQGLGAEHTQVLVDGEPIYSGLAGVYGLQQLGTNDVDRLEIVKGAGSALYGSSAVAGAINIISKEPGYDPDLKADVQFGNWGF